MVYGRLVYLGGKERLIVMGYTQNTPQNTNKHSVKYQRSPTKLVANIPPGVGADSSCPYPDIIKCTYPFHHTRVFTLLNIYIHFIEYTFPFPISWVHSYMRAR